MELSNKTDAEIRAAFGVPEDARIEVTFRAVHAAKPEADDAR